MDILLVKEESVINLKRILIHLEAVVFHKTFLRITDLNTSECSTLMKFCCLILVFKEMENLYKTLRREK